MTVGTLDRGCISVRPGDNIDDDEADEDLPEGKGEQKKVKIGKLKTPSKRSSSQAVASDSEDDNEIKDGNHDVVNYEEDSEGLKHNYHFLFLS
jgi:hypothetical protein